MDNLKAFHQVSALIDLRTPQIFLMAGARTAPTRAAKVVPGATSTVNAWELTGYTVQSHKDLHLPHAVPRLRAFRM